MKRMLMIFFVSFCLASFVLGAWTLSTPVRLAHAAHLQESAFVIVTYKDIPDPVEYYFGQCVPYELNGHLAIMLVFKQSATLYDHPNPDCTGGAVPPIPVSMPKGAVILNAADIAQIIGQGFTGQPNGLP